MTQAITKTSSLARVYADDNRLRPLIGQGGPFEVEDVILNGVPLRDFVRAPRTIVEIFEMGRAHADLVHIVFEEERLTFGDVHAQARSLARELQDTFGVRPGDRVAIAMRNLPEFIVSFWGIALAGGIIVPLNSWWRSWTASDFHASSITAVLNEYTSLASVEVTVTSPSPI
jgi:acyl-CoA synthetase (AMP-forming)/AMP-acid ligase II